MNNRVTGKEKKRAQRAGGAGWNKHVNKFQKRAANKAMRRQQRRGG